MCCILLLLPFLIATVQLTYVSGCRTFIFVTTVDCWLWASCYVILACHGDGRLCCSRWFNFHNVYRTLVHIISSRN